ncbi:MAG: transcription elongation factor GreA [Planctomycetes bacterium]|nr:transcription elongation factor GreA [Planctomycetota bacterium]
MPDRIPMSQIGFDKLKADLARMEHDEMPRIAAEIGRTRAFGDLNENAEFHAAVEAQGLLEARIRDLRDRLARAAIVDPSKMPRDRVVFGATVRVKDLDLDEEETFVLVGAGEEDYDRGRILVTSPLAQGLVGKKAGDVAEIQAPAGVFRFQIVDISFE